MNRLSRAVVAVTVLVFLLVNNTNAELKKIESEYYKEGNEFTLNAYKKSPSVYVRVDSVIEHPFLEVYYVLSFHGVCTKDMRFSNGNQESLELYNAHISHDGLKRSIGSTQIDKKSSLKCENYLPMDVKETNKSIRFGDVGIMLSPLGSTLNLEKKNTLIKIIHN